MFRSGNYDFPIILTSQDPRQKFKFPAISCVDAVAEVLKRESLVVVQMTFDANGEANLLKSAVVNVKPIRVFLEGLLSLLQICLRIWIVNSFKKPKANKFIYQSLQAVPVSVNSGIFKLELAS